MGFKLFGSLIDSVGKVISGVTALRDLPKKERREYLLAMQDAYTVIDGALVMVVLRLGDICESDDEEFLLKVAQLKNFDEWYRTERELRLCGQLRRVYYEAEKVKLIGKICVKDWDGLLKQMRKVLTNENEVALFLSNAFAEVSDLARKALRSGESAPAVRKQVERFRKSLDTERHRLIRQEIALYEIIYGNGKLKPKSPSK